MKKRILAAVLAATMVVGSSMTVMASTPGLDSDGDYNEAGDVTIDGTGSIQTLDDVVKVKLPTSNFTLVADISGAYGALLASGQTSLSSVEKDSLENYAGRLISNQKLAMTNLGSVPVVVTAKVQDQSTGTKTPNHVSSYASATLEGTGDYNVWMAVAPSVTDIKGDVAAYTTDYNGYQFKAAASTDLPFYLEPAKYLVSGDATNGFTQTKDDNDPGHGQAIDIVGFLNTKDNWSTKEGGFAETSGNNGEIKVTVAFNIAVATEQDTAKFEALDDATHYGMIGSGLTAVKVSDDVPADISATTGIYDDAKKKITVAGTLGQGALKDQIVKLSWGGTEANVNNNDITGNTVVEKNGNLVIDAPEAWAGTTSGTKYLKIKLKNAGPKIIAITCTTIEDEPFDITATTGAYSDATQKITIAGTLGTGELQDEVVSMSWGGTQANVNNNDISSNAVTEESGNIVIDAPSAWAGTTTGTKYLKITFKTAGEMVFTINMGA